MSGIDGNQKSRCCVQNVGRRIGIKSEKQTKVKGKSMKCLKQSINTVFVKGCEDCLSKRDALETCFRRGFIWGVPDEDEPEWELTEKEGKLNKDDVSMYYDKGWEGNSHLIVIQKNILSFTKIKHSISVKMRWIVWERDNFTCQNCGERRHLSIDHIYPESKGGPTELFNLQTLCCRCNSQKGCRVDGESSAG